jgi:hypothetical protein
MEAPKFMPLMRAACFLKANHTIVIRTSFLVRNVVINTCNSDLHGDIYVSTSSGRSAAYSENYASVCIALCRELENTKVFTESNLELSLDMCSTSQCLNY